MWGTVLSIGASLLTSEMNSDAAEKGSKISSEASDRASENVMTMYREGETRLQPWVSGGGDALQKLMYRMGLGSGRMGFAPNSAAAAEVERLLMNPSDPKRTTRSQIVGQVAEGWGIKPEQMTSQETTEGGDLLKKFSMADFEADPSYKFRQEEGEKALTRGASARGLAMSTPGLKELMRFNQGLASTEYGAAYGRDAADKQRSFDYLAFLSGSGQNAGAQIGQIGTNAATTSASLTAGAGREAGQGVINSTALNSNSINSGIANYMYQKRYDDMMSRMPVFSTPPTSGAVSPIQYFGGGGNLNMSSYGPAF